MNVLHGEAVWGGLAVARMFPIRAMIFFWDTKKLTFLSNRCEYGTDSLVCVDVMAVKMMSFEHWTLYETVFNLNILSLNIVWSRMAGWLLGHLVLFNMPQGTWGSMTGRILECKKLPDEGLSVFCIEKGKIRKGCHLLVTKKKKLDVER